jgi:hypothetical protein
MDDKWKMSSFNIIKTIISLMLFAGFLLWRKFDHTTGAQLILNGIKDDEFNGRVDSVYRERQDHNIKKVKLANGYIYGLYPEWESKVEKEDSLYKRKGSVIVVVIKKNGTSINLDYSELVKTFKN